MKPDHRLVLKTIETARQNLKQFPELLPTFFVGNQEEVQIVGTPFSNNERDKDTAAEVVKQMAAKMGADFILFVAESYILTDPEATKEWMDGKSKYKYIKDHPLAKEVVIFQLETSTTQQLGVADILKDREMGDVKWNKGDDAKGRFSNLLGQKPSIH